MTRFGDGAGVMLGGEGSSRQSNYPQPPFPFNSELHRNAFQ